MAAIARVNHGARALLARVHHVPGFLWEVLKSFRANQGILLAGAVAYYTLLSLVPLLILILIGLSQIVEPERLLTALSEYLEFLVPGQTQPVLDQLQIVLAQKQVVGGVLLASMLVFSAMAFTVLENAMSVIFHHRVQIRRRHFLVSALLPYVFIVMLGIGLLAATIVSGKLAVLATREVTILGGPHSLDAFSAYLLYLTGVAGEILVVTAIYLVMPVGRMSWRHALIGGVTAALLWEVMRHILVWYYDRLSQIQVVYGSFATAIAILLSVEFAALFLLLGAQVIANYERLLAGKRNDPMPMVVTPAT